MTHLTCTPSLPATVPILAVDIGGTHCRFAGFSLTGGHLTQQNETWLKTEEIGNTDELVAACARSTGVHPRDAEVLVIGLAGPVHDAFRGTLTNADLQIDLSDAQERYGIKLCRVINDFSAEAYACLTPAAAAAQRVLPSEPGQTVLLPAAGPGPIGIVGAGTGLGTASLVRGRDGIWVALPAEGGHAAFPFVGRKEGAFAEFAARELHRDYLRGDDVLTGRGLCLLHRFLTGERLTAPAVAAQALCSPNETLNWYGRFYGRMCRNWVLNTLCKGGLYISGGLAARNPLVVRCAAFRSEFYNTTHLKKLLESVPVFLASGTNSGLWGSAWLGSMLLKKANSGNRSCSKRSKPIFRLRRNAACRRNS